MSKQNLAMISVFSLSILYDDLLENVFRPVSQFYLQTKLPTELLADILYMLFTVKSI